MALFALHQRITQHEPAGLVRCDTLEHFEQRLQAPNSVYAGFAENAGMVAYGVYSRNSPACQELAHLMGLTDTQRKAFAVLDGSGVLPHWRGLGLQEHLISLRMAQGLHEECHTLGATSAPENSWSLYNLLQAGFHVHTAALLYAGMPRLVLRYTAGQKEAHWTELQNIASTDFEAQSTAMRMGWKGYATSGEPSPKMQIRYGR
jgi:hypothetical protein